MAGLAYVLLPVSGLVAFFKGGSQRIRFHGLQAIVVGALWPLLLYGATWTEPIVTQIVFLLGAVLWIALIVTAAAGRDLQLPWVGRHLWREAETSFVEDRFSPRP